MLLSFGAVLACPGCQPALEARARVLSDSFWTNVWYAILPFAITFVIIHWLRRGILRDV